MSKSNRAPRILVETTPEPIVEIAIAEQIALPRSVVKPAYKVKYRDQARARGNMGKAPKRSKWDWLAENLAYWCLDSKAKIDIARFVAILELNGIEAPLTRWPNQSPGWQGRLRMTGRLALQKLVAQAGVLRVPAEDGEIEELVAPAEWAAKFLD
jgi:hypothetical protein